MKRSLNTALRSAASPKRSSQKNKAKGKRLKAASGASAARAAAAATGILVVNMIPRSLSGETNQDSEPMIAVNPANADHIVGTAFTQDPMGSGLAPYFVSTDGGNTWSLNAVVPGGNATGDITVSFSGKGDNLYAGILRQDSPTNDTRMAILRAANFASPNAMTVLNDRQEPDQPFAQAATVSNGTDAGKERLYVGSNDFAGSPRTATLDIALNAGAAAPTIKRVRLERRTTVGQDGPQVRPCIHAGGTIYAVFYGWRSQSGNWQANTLKVKADVVVVRDDSWGTSQNPFEDLKDPVDGIVGRRVAQGVEFSFNLHGTSQNGQQRLGGTLSIAVDPRPTTSSTVYLAWGADDPTSGFGIHVRKSSDRGVTWSQTDLLSLPRATNAALAINTNGVVGLLYQRLVGTGAQLRWETHFRQTSNDTNWSDLVLATTPASGPIKTFDPYLGDYDHLVAVGENFYGIFSSSNTPDPANFPSGVVYQRNADFTSRKLFDLDGNTQIKASIDPFFFRVSG